MDADDADDADITDNQRRGYGNSYHYFRKGELTIMYDFQIQKDSYKIGKIEEFEVLTETMTEMKTQNEQLKEEVKQMKQSIEKESEEIRSMLKEEARQREMKIKEVKKEIDDKEQKIEKVSIISEQV